MSRIVKISRLRGLGIFRDFDWPADLATFGRYNLIYGWNASGKTTLSRVFRDVEMKKAPSSGQVTLDIDGNEVAGEAFPRLDTPIKVFNRDFVNENVLQMGDRGLPPIFVLGKQSAEQQRRVEALKVRLDGTRSALQSQNGRADALRRELDRLCIDRAGVIKDTLRSSGPNPYNTYDKSDFRKSAGKMVGDGDAASYLLSDSDREALLLQHRASQKPKLAEIDYRLPALGSLWGAAGSLLAETATSRVISSLKGDALLSEWILRGLGLHLDRKEDRCLFCEQALPTDRLVALQLHFSKEYEELQRRIDDLIGEIEGVSRAASSVGLPNRAELYEDLAEGYADAVSALKDALESVSASLGALVGKLREKKELTFEAIPVGVSIPEIDATVVDRLNAVIREHNRASDDFQGRASRARQRLEADFVARSLGEVRRLTGEIETSSMLAGGAQAECSKLQDEILGLERDIVEHRRPAEELNEELSRYLGHDELLLETRETGYAVLRNGAPAEAISEGELTAVSLLYFLKCLKDRAFELEHGIVVLDDPVSSLDANALFLAFGYTRERTKDAGQLFILTHNFAFFRQVRNWLHYLNRRRGGAERRPGRFYMLDAAAFQGQRRASIRALDPLLEEYESEYHYLFARVHAAATATGPTSLEGNYVIPNIARRLLEGFLAFRRPHVSGDLWHKLQEVQFEEAKKCRIIRFLHTYSHDDAIAEPEHDPSLLAEARATLLDMLDLIKAEDPGHYEAMERLVAGPAEDIVDR